MQRRKPGEHPVSYGTDKIVTKSGALGRQPDKHATLQEMKGKGRLPKGFVFSEMQPTLPSEHELTISYDVIDKDQSKTYPILFSVEWKDFFMAANRGEIAIYVWGNIDFLDIYDRKWTQNFCYRYASEGAASARFTTHDEYNDERCLEDPTKRRPCWRRRPFGIP
jgi:hypothetical protein